MRDKQKIRIAKRVAQEFKDGDLVNLGIGLPTLVPDYLPRNVHITLLSDNGIVGAGPGPIPENPYIQDAGGRPASVIPSGSFIDSATAFGLVRGGHVDSTVLALWRLMKKETCPIGLFPGNLSMEWAAPWISSSARKK